MPTTMIPSTPPHFAHQFEKDLFRIFEQAPADWVVLPGFYVRKSENHVRPRELDFVILMPKTYTVMYVEAKSGHYVYEKRGWFRQRAKHPVSPSPTEQASTGLTVLQDRIGQFISGHRDEYGSESLLSFTCAVAFRDVDPEDEAENSDDLKKLAWLFGRSTLEDPKKLVEVLEDFAETMRKPREFSMEGWNEFKVEIAKKQFEGVRNKFFSSTRQFPITAGVFRRVDLESLRSEFVPLRPMQQRVLNRVQARDRCVVHGGAGTGKTVLALDISRIRCEEYGETIGLLCSNPNLAGRFEIWADSLSQDTGGRVVPGTLTTLPLNAFGDDSQFALRHKQRLETYPNLEESLKRGELEQGWDDFFTDVLADLDEPAIFDYLVVDEAQNLCDEVFLRVMDRLLKRGLSDGKWAMFGDFENQNIVVPRRRTSQGLDDHLRKLGTSFAEQDLVENCRNTYEIAATTANITGIEMPALAGANGPPVEFKYFDSNNRLQQLLEAQLAHWERRRFESKQIIIITNEIGNSLPRDFTSSTWKLVDLREASLGVNSQVDPLSISYDETTSVRYSDIFDFQGLESDLVILVIPLTGQQSSLEGANTLPHYDQLTRVVYTGMSRAKIKLVVMAHEGYREFLEPPNL